MSLYVARLWRYPVKTLAGERLPMTALTTDGLPSDRIVSRPARAHIHTVVHTPNGNDYGADLLRQHLSAHEH